MAVSDDDNISSDSNELMNKNTEGFVDSSSRLSPTDSENDNSGYSVEAVIMNDMNSSGVAIHHAETNINVPTSTENSDSETNNNESNIIDDMAQYRHLHSQHIAKSLVDNAINKTLEDLGLAPGENSWLTPYVRHRERIETEGVMEAIRARGLRRHSLPVGHGQRDADNSDTDDEMDSVDRRHLQLNPILNRITQVSENIFAHNPLPPIPPPISAASLSVTSGGDTVLSSNAGNLDLPLSDGNADTSEEEELMSDTSSTPDGDNLLQTESFARREHTKSDSATLGHLVETDPSFSLHADNPVPSLTDPQFSTTDAGNPLNSVDETDSCNSTEHSNPLANVSRQDFLAQAVGAAITEKGLML